MRIMAILAGVGAAMAVPAPAAVTSSSEWGFATESQVEIAAGADACLLYTSPSPRDS